MITLLQRLGDQNAAIPGTGAKPERVAKLEADLAVSLPQNYRDFLRSWGTAVVDSTEVFGLRVDAKAKRLVSSDVDRVTKKFRQWVKIAWPKDFVCIAEDGRGGCFCLATAKTKNGDCPVVYFDHEAVEQRAGILVPKFERVAPSFKAWLKLLAKSGAH